MAEPQPPIQMQKVDLGKIAKKIGQPFERYFGTESLKVDGLGDATVLRVKEGKELTVNGQNVEEFTIKGVDKRSPSGVGSATILVERGVRWRKPTLTEFKVNPGDQVELHNIKGIRFKEQTGQNPDGTPILTDKDVDFAQFFEVKKAEAQPQPTPRPQTPERSDGGQAEPTPAPQPEPAQPAARATQTLQGEAPRNILTMVGELGVRDRASELVNRFFDTWKEKSIEKVGRFRSELSLKNIFEQFYKFKRTEFTKKALIDTANMLTDESLTLAETNAKAKVEQELSRLTGWKKIKETLKVKLAERFGARSMLDDFTIAELRTMKGSPTGLREEAAYINEEQAVNRRVAEVIEGDLVSLHTFIRENLGETKPIKLDLNDPNHKMIIDGVNNLVKQHIADTAGFRTATELRDEFQKVVKNLSEAERKKLFGDAELFSSSVYQFAEHLKNEVNLGHLVGTNAIDERLAATEFRVAVAAMGEVTKLEKTETEKLLARISKLPNFKGNDYVVGSALSFILSLKVLPMYGFRSAARVWTGGIGGAAVTGVWAGLKEKSRLTTEYRKFLRQREAGMTPNASWFERFGIKLRTTEDLIQGMSEPDNEKAAAHLADARARKLGYEWKGLPIGLIDLGPKGQQEVNRTNLDLKINETTQRLQGSIDLDQLTQAQAIILRTGIANAATVTDPLKATLGVVHDFAPEVEVIRRRRWWNFLSKKETIKGEGLDAVVKEFTEAANAEARKRGLKAGGAGLLIGATASEIVQDLIAMPIQTGHVGLVGPWSAGIREIFGSGAGGDLGLTLRYLTGQAGEAMIADVPAGHVGLAESLRIDPQGNLDYLDASGKIHEDVVKDFANHAKFTDDGNWTPEFKDYVNDQLKTNDLNLQLSYNQIEMDWTPPDHFVSPVEFKIPGAEHDLTFGMPEGGTLVQSGDTYTFALDGKDVVEGIKLDPATGEMVNFDEVHQKLLDAGWDIQHELLQGGESLEVPKGDVSWHANEWDNQGYWGYVGSQIHEQDIEHAPAAQNALKNIFRGYEHYYTDANHDGFADNVKVIQPEGYPEGTRILHLRDGSTHWFDQDAAGNFIKVEDASGVERGITEIEWNKLPGTGDSGGDTVISELPGFFAKTGLIEYAHYSDEAVKRFMELQEQHGDWTTTQVLEAIKSTDPDPIHGEILRIAAKLGYVGTEDFMPTKEEIAFLMNHIGSEGTITELHQYDIFDPTVMANVMNVSEVTETEPWPIPIIAPTSQGPVVKPGTPTPPAGPTGYGYGYGYGYGTAGGTRARLQQLTRAGITRQEREEQALPSLLSVAFTRWGIATNEQQRITGLTPPEQAAWLQEEAQRQVAPATTPATPQTIETIASTLGVNLPPEIEQAPPPPRTTPRPTPAPAPRPRPNSTPAPTAGTPEADLTMFVADENTSPVEQNARANAVNLAQRFMALSDLEEAERRGGLTKVESGEVYKNMLSWLSTQNMVDVIRDDPSFNATLKQQVYDAALPFSWDDQVEAKKLTNAMMRFLNQIGSGIPIITEGDRTANLFVLFSAFDSMKALPLRTPVAP